MEPVYWHRTYKPQFYIATSRNSTIYQKKIKKELHNRIPAKAGTPTNHAERMLVRLGKVQHLPGVERGDNPAVMVRNGHRRPARYSIGASSLEIRPSWAILPLIDGRMGVQSSVLSKLRHPLHFPEYTPLSHPLSSLHQFLFAFLVKSTDGFSRI